MRRAWGILALLGAAVALVAPAVGFSDTSLPGRQGEVQERLRVARQRIEAARQREALLNEEIDRKNGEIADVRRRTHAAADKLAGLERRLAASRSRLDELRRRLKAQTEQLERLRSLLAVARDHLAQRVVAIYTGEQPDVLSVVLGADSLDDVIDQLELYQRTVEFDRKLVSDTESLRAEVGDVRASTRRLDGQQASVVSSLAADAAERQERVNELVAERTSLEALQAEREHSLARIVVERKEWEREADSLDAERASIASLLEQRASAAAAPSEETDGHVHPATPESGSASSGFMWPLRGTITSPYGMRWGRLHSGIDIAAPAGLPIAAAAAGTVVYAGAMGGYGLIVVIEHGNGLATAYAHNSALYVSAGQTVAQGQRIAAVGCTGHCTGNHVHFEVRVGGTAVDPLGYL